MRLRDAVLAAALTMTISATGAQAQEKDPPNDGKVTRVFFLENSSTSNESREANEVLTALRNTLDSSIRMMLDYSQSAIVVHGTPDQLAQVQKLIAELDRPRKVYRLTYTITEMDAGKKIGVQHFSMIVAGGGRAVMKQGSRVPVVTGQYDQEKNGTQTQMTYLDVGLNFDATVDRLANGISLKSKVEQSSVAEEHSGVGPGDPIVRQTVLESTSQVALDKPVALGSLDVPGSTRHIDVEALVDLVK